MVLVPSLQFDIYRRWIPKPPRFSNIVEYVNNYQFRVNEEEEPVEDNI